MKKIILTLALALTTISVNARAAKNELQCQNQAQYVLNMGLKAGQATEKAVFIGFSHNVSEVAKDYGVERYEIYSTEDGKYCMKFSAEAPESEPDCSTQTIVTSGSCGLLQADDKGNVTSVFAIDSK